MQSNNVTWDLGSFRDPAGSIFFKDEKVYRSLSEKSSPVMKKLLNEDFFKNHMNSGEIITTQLEDNNFAEVNASSILKHQKIDFINYPYEWSFNMLKDAALLTLKILKNCLLNGYILKDGSAWNLTFYKGRMVFFDVLSIDKYREGQTWDGYQQFCSEFLYPLLISAYKGIDFHPFFRGCLTGVDTDIAYNFFGMRDLFKPGVFKHVFLNKALNSSVTVSSATIQDKVKMPKVALISLIDKLIDSVDKLQCKKLKSNWLDYTNTNTYEKQDDDVKKIFIKDFCESIGSSEATVIDMGCNTGMYSLIAHDYVNVISADIDSKCIDAIYRKIKSDFITNITPVTLNLMNPSADFGWDLSERVSIFKRLDCDGFLALALIHHICIVNNVPLERFIQLLSKVAKRGVLEWVDKKDPMVIFLLRNRQDIFENYTWEHFEAIVNKYFVIKKIEVINNQCRKLCWLEARD